MVMAMPQSVLRGDGRWRIFLLYDGHSIKQERGIGIVWIFLYYLRRYESQMYLSVAL